MSCGNCEKRKIASKKRGCRLLYCKICRECNHCHLNNRSRDGSHLFVDARDNKKWKECPPGKSIIPGCRNHVPV